MTRLRNAQIDAIIEAFPVPPYVRSAANACRMDLLHGPSFVLIPKNDVTLFTINCCSPFADDFDIDADAGDVVVETYTSAVADGLRAFIDDLPSSVWIDPQTDEIVTTEPEGGYDEELEVYIEPDLHYHVSHRILVEILFGQTIAREFR